MRSRGREAAKGERRARMLVPVVAAALLVTCQRPADPPPPGTPRLVVLIVVDQMRGDYLERFDRYWQGGLRHLLDHGLVFTDAHQDHAITATAPGHATLATGCFPSRHEVFDNYWIDRETGDEVYSAEDADSDTTPERLECSALGDWLKARYPAAKVFAISPKDRSAVLMGGKEADGAFFYDEEKGEWESAEYYYDDEPEWVEEFNDRRLLDRYFGKDWETLAASPEDLAATGVAPFDLGPLEPDLPIAFGDLEPAPGEAFYDALLTSPFIDEFTARFAEHVVGAEALGGDAAPDLLALGFSAPDYVGHDFGPDSPQLLDTLRRLDQTLGELFDFLDRRVGLEHVVLALSSDHGVVPVPEIRQAHGLPGRRTETADVLCMQRVHERLRGRFGEGAWLLPGPFVNRRAAKAAGRKVEEVEAASAELIEGCPGVAAVWTRSELLKPETAADPRGRLFVHSFPPAIGPDLMIDREEFFLPSRRSAASHGTAWTYDTHVPLLIAGPGIGAGVRLERVRTADLAPTLASVLGAPTLGEVDGVDLLPPGRSTPPDR